MESNNRIVVPEAQSAMEQFKQQAASEVGVTLNKGYNGDLTSRQAGSIGGQMVKDVLPTRTAKFERENRIVNGHKTTVRYKFGLTV